MISLSGLVPGFSNPTGALDERNSVGPRLTFQDKMDENQSLPSSEAGHPTITTVADDVHHIDEHASERRVVRPDADVDICSFFHQLEVLATPEEGRSIAWRCPGVGSNISVMLALVDR